MEACTGFTASPWNSLRDLMLVKCQIRGSLKYVQNHKLKTHKYTKYTSTVNSNTQSYVLASWQDDKRQETCCSEKIPRSIEWGESAINATRRSTTRGKLIERAKWSEWQRRHCTLPLQSSAKIESLGLLYWLGSQGEYSMDKLKLNM